MCVYSLPIFRKDLKNKIMEHTVMTESQTRYDNLTLYLTLNCNLNCSYCFCGKKYTQEMSMDTAQKAIALFDKKSMEKSNIAFFGGEPLLKLDLIKKIIELNQNEYKNKFTFSITTNGTLLTENVYSYLRQNNVNVLLSMDGSKESHDLNRKHYDGSGSWDTIFHNIQSFIGELPVRMTFSKTTVEKLFENLVALYELGFASVAFYPASGDEWNEHDFYVFDREIIKFVEYIYNHYCGGRAIHSHWIDKSISRHISGVMDSCNPGVTQFSVLPNGELFPCNHTNFSSKDLQIGSLEKGLDEKKVFWLLEQSKITDEECQDCCLKDRCNYCYINMYEETGELWKIPDWYCRMNQTVIMYADQLASRLYSKRNPAFMKKFYYIEEPSEE